VRVVAVDWSGRRAGQERAIWLAEARGDELLRLEAGRTRAEVVDHLVDLAARDPNLVVGFDFSFSLPEWFLVERGYAAVDELWDAAARDGEGWLRECAPPFWGRPGRPRPELPAHWRATEEAIAHHVPGVRPKSTFQVGGAGSVGTGSIRGFPELARLRRAGFAIWPFDEPRAPGAFEVWPRACTGVVVKSRPTARARLLDTRFPHLDASARGLAVASEDAFDAAITALVMSSRLGTLEALHALGRPPDSKAILEGWVWMPYRARG
jgi:hypothetical protein